MSIGSGDSRKPHSTDTVSRADGARPIAHLPAGRATKENDHMSKPELVVAPLTPFTADLKIDAAALKREIDYVVGDCGATMVVAAGVEAQEYTYLGMVERKELIRLTLEFVAGR